MMPPWPGAPPMQGPPPVAWMNSQVGAPPVAILPQFASAVWVLAVYLLHLSFVGQMISPCATVNFCAQAVEMVSVGSLRLPRYTRAHSFYWTCVKRNVLPPSCLWPSESLPGAPWVLLGFSWVLSGYTMIRVSHRCHLFIYSSIHLFIYSCMYSFIYSFIHLFIYSFIH